MLTLGYVTKNLCFKFIDISPDGVRWFVMKTWRVELMMILGKVINPVILALVMVDHHYGDECYSGDDHRSYDDDH